jgi:DNA-binding NtrC family response regulator
MSNDNLKVMLVDDDNDILQTVRQGLEHAGFEVHGFIDPIEALNQIEHDCEDCKVMVCDIRMPQMNGFQLVRRAKEMRPDMNIIMMTAFEVNMMEFQSVFPSLPVDRVLRKPFMPSKLASIISELYPIKQTA